MHERVRRSNRLSPLGIIVVVSLVALLAGGVFLVLGVTELLGLENGAAADTIPSVDRF